MVLSLFCIRLLADESFWGDDDAFGGKESSVKTGNQKERTPGGYPCHACLHRPDVTSCLYRNSQGTDGILEKMIKFKM